MYTKEQIQNALKRYKILQCSEKAIPNEEEFLRVLEKEILFTIPIEET